MNMYIVDFERQSIFNFLFRHLEFTQSL